MIVDFINIRRRFERFAFTYLKSVENRESGFLNEMRRYVIHEGDSWSYQTVENETIESDLQKIEAVVDLPLEKFATMRFQQVLDLYSRMASQLVEQKQRLFFDRVTEAVEVSGNSIEAEGMSFSDATLAMLESMHIDFDDYRNRPNLPTIITNKANYEAIKATDASMKDEERYEYKRRQDEILDRKYEEYVLRESNRKLVD